MLVFRSQHSDVMYQEAEEKAKEEEAAAAAASKGGKKGVQTLKVVDTDPDGEKLLQVTVNLVVQMHECLVHCSSVSNLFWGNVVSKLQFAGRRSARRSNQIFKAFTRP